MAVVLFHGSFGTPQGNWFPTFTKRLQEEGVTVYSPAFPIDDYDEISRQGQSASMKNQLLENWLATYEKWHKTIKNDGEKVFVGHSLGAVFILHLVEKFGVQLDAAIFVAPFLEKLGRNWQIDLANKSFYKKDFDFTKLKKNLGETFVVYSDNDPYVDEKFPLDFADKLGSQKILVRGAKHFSESGGVRKLGIVEELCLTRLPFKGKL